MPKTNGKRKRRKQRACHVLHTYIAHSHVDTYRNMQRGSEEERRNGEEERRD